MPSRFFSRLLTSLALLLSFGLSVQAQAPATPTAPVASETGRSSPVSKIEVQQLVDLLERYHYAKEQVRPASYQNVITEFMDDLDAQKLFFLSSDKLNFHKKYDSTIYYNLRNLGAIDVAYDVYGVYEQRVRARIAWIFDELKKDQDLNTKDFYRIDRADSEWVDTAEASDLLWSKRIRFEIINELLNKKTVEKAKEAVRKRYERWLKNVDEVENIDIAEIFLSSYTRMYDPHSVYFSADTYEDFGIQMKLQLVGIGALLGVEDDVCVIKEIIPGGPADLDKRLKPNDKILAVAQDGVEPVDIIGMKLRKIVDQIRGQKGTKVHLIVQPANDVDGSARKEIVLTRDIVKLNSSRAHAAIFEVPSADGKSTISMGVISLPSFYGGEPAEDGGEPSSCSRDVKELLERLKAQNVQAVVLDLRRNGGGLLTEAIAISGLFISSGPVVQVKDFSGHIEIDEDEDRSVTYSGPLAVLVDKFSASASEIVAGALQNYGRGIIIGDESTHGKGTVQTVIEMKRVISGLHMPVAKTGAVKLTIQKFYLPSGASTQRKGVIPDIVLPSWEIYLPNVGESDLKHALSWDEIPTSLFDGKPLDTSLLGLLREESVKRQKSLPEFSFLNKNIAWFRTRQEQKMVSLNLDERRKQKDADKAFDKEMKASRLQLEKSNFAFKEVRLAPPPPPRVKAEKKPDDDPDSLDDGSDDEQAESYARLDIDLREALRVIADSMQLSKDPTKWKFSYAPLSLQASQAGALTN